MAQYILKSALVAEIEKLLDKGKYHEEYDCAYRDGNNSALYALKGRIDTLEVKEVDLCKEEERIWKDFNMGERHLSKNDLEKISKYFFSLGMQVSNKAQKGEEYDRQRERT